VIGLQPYVETKHACPVDHLSALWTWINTNKWIVAGALIFIGFVVCFFGNTFLAPILWLTGVFQASFIIMAISYSTFANTSS
jgi:hypothetical protein